MSDDERRKSGRRESEVTKGPFHPQFLSRSVVCLRVWAEQPPERAFQNIAHEPTENEDDEGFIHDQRSGITRPSCCAFSWERYYWRPKKTRSASPAAALAVKTHTPCCSRFSFVPDQDENGGGADSQGEAHVDLFASIALLSDASGKLKELLASPAGTEFECAGVKYVIQNLAAQGTAPVIEIHGCSTDDFTVFLRLVNAYAHIRKLAEWPVLPCKDIFKALRYSLALHTHDLTKLLLKTADQIASAAAPEAARDIVRFAETTCAALSADNPLEAWPLTFWSADALSSVWVAMSPTTGDALRLVNPRTLSALCHRSLHRMLCALHVRGFDVTLSWQDPELDSGRHDGGDGSQYASAGSQLAKQPALMMGGRPTLGEGAWVLFQGSSKRRRQAPSSQGRGSEQREREWSLVAEARVLVDNSPVLAAMLQGGWREAREGLVQVTEYAREEMEAFLLVVHALDARPSLPLRTVLQALPVCLFYQAHRAVEYLLRQAERLAERLRGHALLDFMVEVEEIVVKHEAEQPARSGRLQPCWGRAALNSLLEHTSLVWHPLDACAQLGDVSCKTMVWATGHAHGLAMQRLGRATLERLLSGIEFSGVGLHVVRTAELREAVLSMLVEEGGEERAAMRRRCQCAECRLDSSEHRWMDRGQVDLPGFPLCSHTFTCRGEDESGEGAAVDLDVRVAAMSYQDVAVEVSKLWRTALSGREVANVVQELEQEGLVFSSPSAAEISHYHDENNWSEDDSQYHLPPACRHQVPRSERVEFDPEWPRWDKRFVSVHDLQCQQAADRCLSAGCSGWQALVWGLKSNRFV